MARCFAALAIFLTIFTPATAQTSEVQVSHRERSLQPGEIVLLTVQGRMSLREVSGSAFGRTVSFHREASDDSWVGLAGIDLDTLPGSKTVSIEAVDSSGRRLQKQLALVVKKKAFPTRRLTVDAKYVTPPAAVMKRIRRESLEVSGIFKTNTAKTLWDGWFARPVPGILISSFGKRSILNGKPRSPHGGVDLRAAEGTPIKAPNGGRVVLAKNLYFSGNTVILDHGQGLYSYFGHLSRFAVKEGDSVSREQVVGYAGATGRVSGPHLHWSVRLHGARVDPMSLLFALGDK